MTFFYSVLVDSATGVQRHRVKDFGILKIQMKINQKINILNIYLLDCTDLLFSPM